MSKVVAVMGREVRFYLNTFAFYFVLALFAAIAGYFFWSSLSYFSLVSFQVATNPSTQVKGLNLVEGVASPFLLNVSALMLLVIPILAMRSFAEERQSGTLELLVTYPISDIEIVMGKFLALAALLFLLVSPTVSFFFLAQAVAPHFEAVSLAMGYLGLFLVGASFVSLCMFISSLTQYQAVSAAVGFVLLLFFWIVGWMADWASPPLGAVFRELSLTEHFRDFTRGVLDTRDILFYVLFVSFFLFATLASLDVRTWKR